MNQRRVLSAMKTLTTALILSILALITSLTHIHSINNQLQQTIQANEKKYELIKAYEVCYDNFEEYMVDGGGYDVLETGELPYALEVMLNNYQKVDSIYATEQ